MNKIPLGLKWFINGLYGKYGVVKMPKNNENWKNCPHWDKIGLKCLANKNEDFYQRCMIKIFQINTNYESCSIYQLEMKKQSVNKLKDWF